MFNTIFLSTVLIITEKRRNVKSETKKNEFFIFAVFPSGVFRKEA